MGSSQRDPLQVGSRQHRWLVFLPGCWASRLPIVSRMAAPIPEAQVRLFGSRARGTARSDSDVDLLITVPDHWLAGRDRVRVLGALWREYSSHRLSLDLLLYSESEVSQRQPYRSAVTTQAYQEGILLHG